MCLHSLFFPVNTILVLILWLWIGMKFFSIQENATHCEYPSLNWKSVAVIKNLQTPTYADFHVHMKEMSLKFFKWSDDCWAQMWWMWSIVGFLLTVFFALISFFLC